MKFEEREEETGNFMKIIIDNETNLTLEQLWQLIFEETKLELSENAKVAVQASADYITKVMESDAVVYGVNTGFGNLAKVSIPHNKILQLQKNIVLSHAVGTGALLPAATVKLILALKINSLARGYSGVRLETMHYLIAFFNHGYFPCVPSKGSVGASGDLAPLAHLVLPLLGESSVHIGEKIIPATEALQQLQLKPIQLAAKEGLALLNGTQVSTAIALVNYFLLERIFSAAIFSGALTTVAAGGSPNSFNALIHQIRGQLAQQDVAKMYADLLADTQYQVAKERVQSPYCIRCQPQVMGACLQQMRNGITVLHNEADGVSDNPLIFVKENKILSGGNFHAEPIAMAADNLALCFAEIASIAERRIAMLIDTNISGLPPFLVPEPGINSGFMLAQVTAAALVSENKALAHPASVDSIPTSANQEDHVSMATFAARRLSEMAENSATVIAIELLAACQGVDFAKPVLGKKLQAVYDLVRQHSAFYERDRFFANDIELVKNLILAGGFELDYH